MIDKDFTIPLYIKASIFLIGLIALVTILYIVQGIIIPLIFSVIIAIVLHPVISLFVRKKMNRIVAIVITLTLTFFVFAAVGTLVISQASRFSASWPLLIVKFSTVLDQTVSWVSVYFDINPQYINDWIVKSKSELIHINSAVIGQALVKVGSSVMVLLLIPFYVFIILYYKSLLLEFVHQLFSASSQHKVNEIITQIKTVIQQYLIGLVIEFIIVAILSSFALFLLGIEYAILLGVIGALLNIIPYIGGIIGVAIPMMVALATKSTPLYAIYVLIVYYVIQLIDNNYIVPIIVASKVKINALFSVIVVIAGNQLWGISGMFLSIPLLAITKLIFDHIESLKPWGFLLGDTTPSIRHRKKLKFKLYDRS